LTASQYRAVGQAACAVSSSLALLIQEPEHWRTAALVATARLLERQVGLSAAAHVAAAAAREFNSAVTDGSQQTEVFTIGQAARGAVESNADADAVHVMRLISARLDSAAPGPAGSRTGRRPLRHGRIDRLHDLGPRKKISIRSTRGQRPAFHLTFRLDTQGKDAPSSI